jgi:hypothetical protein
MQLPPAPQPPQFSPAVSLHQQQQKSMMRHMSPQSPRRPLPHLMSSSAHNGMLMTRMTNEHGQNIDIYENPSEHYGSHAPNSGASIFLPTMQPATTYGSSPLLGLRGNFLNSSQRQNFGKSC